MSSQEILLQWGFCLRYVINVGIEPSLQPVTGEQFSYHSANAEDSSCVNVVAESFWNRGQQAYFDVN